ncbi:hypothetical protein KIPB_012948, partial [Kipferlia bialata]|eukprot:g12948.t1
MVPPGPPGRGPPKSQDLPKGWKRAVDSKTQKVFYYNRGMNKSTWKREEVFAIQSAQTSGNGPEVPKATPLPPVTAGLPAPTKRPTLSRLPARGRSPTPARTLPSSPLPSVPKPSGRRSASRGPSVARSPSQGRQGPAPAAMALPTLVLPAMTVSRSETPGIAAESEAKAKKAKGKRKGAGPPRDTRCMMVAIVALLVVIILLTVFAIVVTTSVTSLVVALQYLRYDSDTGSLEFADTFVITHEETVGIGVSDPAASLEILKSRDIPHVRLAADDECVIQMGSTNSGGAFSAAASITAETGGDLTLEADSGMVLDPL